MIILISFILYSVTLKPYWYLNLKFQPVEDTFYASSNIIEEDSSHYIFYSFNETGAGTEIEIDNNYYILVHTTIFSFADFSYLLPAIEASFRRTFKDISVYTGALLSLEMGTPDLKRTFPSGFIIGINRSKYVSEFEFVIDIQYKNMFYPENINPQSLSTVLSVRYFSGILASSVFLGIEKNLNFNHSYYGIGGIKFGIGDFPPFFLWNKKFSERKINYLFQDVRP